MILDGYISRKQTNCLSYNLFFSKCIPCNSNDRAMREEPPDSGNRDLYFQ